MPYCIHCGQQYQQPANFCMACGKRLPAPVAPVATNVAAKPAPLSRNGKIFMLLLTVFVVVMGTISIVLDNASHKKITEQKEKEDYVSSETVTDSAVAIMPDRVEENVEKDTTIITVAPPMDEAVPPVAYDTASPPPAALPSKPPELPSYVKTDGELWYNSPCFVIITGFYYDGKMAKKEAKRLQTKGYSGAYCYMGNFPAFKGKEVYATVVGPYQTYSECQEGLRTLRKIGPFWYGVKLSYDIYEHVEIRP